MASSKEPGSEDGAIMRHRLPQIPTPAASRMAVSKASLKQYPDNIKPFANVVSMEELEGKKEEEEAEEPAENETPRSSPQKYVGSPELISESEPQSPQEEEAPPSPIAATSPTSPIKLKIMRSIEKGKSKLVSSLQEDEDDEDGEPKVFGVVRKGLPRRKQKKPKHSKRIESDEPSSTVDSEMSPPKKRRGRKSRTKTNEEEDVTDDVPTSTSDAPAPQADSSIAETLPPAPNVKRAATFVPEKKPQLSLSHPPKWLVGDLVWAKVSGHPWWPCMVSYDPLLGIYVREVGNNKIREYHVQFFGDVPERGWIKEPSTKEFQGLDEFEEWTAKMIATNKRDKAKYEVAVRKRRAWSIAVVAGEGALPLTRSERRTNYTFLYEPPKSESSKDAKDSKSGSPPNGVVRRGPKTKQIKRKKKSLMSESETTGAEESETEPPRKRQKRGSISKKPERLDTSMSPPHQPTQLSPSQVKASNKLANKEVAQFMVFCQKRKEQVREDNPDFSDLQIEHLLQQTWTEMAQEERCRFIPMGSDVQNLSDMLPDDQAVIGSFSDGGKRPRRHSRPSKKVEEPEFEAPAVPMAAPKKRRKSSVAASAGHDCGDKSGEEGIDDVINGVAAGGGHIHKPKDWGGSSSENEGGRKKSKKEKEEQQRKAIASSDDQEEEFFDLEFYRLGNGGPSRKENVCILCEEPGELINCDGLCLGSYHPKCLGLQALPAEPFKCDECLSGTHTCFVCKKSEANVRKCSVVHCGRFYHEDCIKHFKNARVEDGKIYCPLHMCATCTADNPKNPKATKGRLYRCVRCPTAYHNGDYCIAAGSMHLAGFNIVCSRHFQPVKTQSHHSHINVSWCFSCSKGGTLLCCETCPSAFHAECLEIDPPGESEAWYCPGCLSGCKPLYGNIVWVKLGSYRWWPGQICHPRNVPLNIQEKPHQVGEFPVCFFGSKDYFWTHQGRVFIFQDGDKGTRESSGAKGLVKTYQKAVREAVKAFELWSQAVSEKEQQEIERSGKKPPPYKHIKCNVPVGNVQIYKANISEITKCECKPDAESPCGHESSCYNRLLMYECHPQVCPTGEKCKNQRFQRREYPQTEIIKTDMSGWGLKTLVDLKKHTFVHEYVGELIDEDECRKRLGQAHEENNSNYYMLTIDKNRIIDAGPKGNLSRFMNHSCNPNCETQKWTVGGDIRVGLFAKMEIPAGTELTFNYNLDALGNEKKVCHCGAPNCSGFLGARPKTNGNNEHKKEKKKKKKRKPNMKKEHEDSCYRCGDGGELVMCDKIGCPKAYHVQCLNLAKPPHGKWTCPWHHCDECGKLATKLCSECPNSFCHTHCPDNIFDVGGENLICTEHEETLLAIESSRRERGAPGIKPLIDDGVSVTPSESTMSSRASSPAVSEVESLSGSKSSESGRLHIAESGSSAPASARSTPRHEPELAAKLKSRRSSSRSDTLQGPPQENPSSSKGDSGSSKKDTSKKDTSKKDTPKERKSKGGRESTGEKRPRGRPPKPKGQEAEVKTEAKRQSTGSSGKKRGRKPKSSLEGAKGSNNEPVAKGKRKTVENNNQVGGSPMFDDTDEENFGNLVIDIPTV